MLEGVADSLPNGSRRARLLSCAFARLVWDLLVDPRSRRAVEIAELIADGAATERQRALATGKADKVGGTLSQGPAETAHILVAGVAEICVIREVGALWACRLVSLASTGYQQQLRAIPDLVRDIVGNPFQPAAFAQEWRTSTAVALALQMYNSRDFSAMPILADALQDAGSENDDILKHCRDANQVHVRGCWVVDLVLGKT